MIVEVRMDGPFFNDEIVTALRKQGIEFTMSVPFFNATVASPPYQAKLVSTSCARKHLKQRVLHEFGYVIVTEPIRRL